MNGTIDPIITIWPTILFSLSIILAGWFCIYIGKKLRHWFGPRGSVGETK